MAPLPNTCTALQAQTNSDWCLQSDAQIFDRMMAFLGGIEFRNDTETTVSDLLCFNPQTFSLGVAHCKFGNSVMETHHTTSALFPNQELGAVVVSVPAAVVRDFCTRP